MKDHSVGCSRVQIAKIKKEYNQKVGYRPLYEMFTFRSGVDGEPVHILQVVKIERVGNGPLYIKT